MEGGGGDGGGGRGGGTLTRRHGTMYSECDPFFYLQKGSPKPKATTFRAQDTNPEP